MKRRLYAPAVLFAGLLSAQIVATAHVYLSNRDLLQATEALMNAGYLTVPNAHVAKQLDSLTTAMAGGLFFTFSVGAGLSIFTLIVVWIWNRVFRCRRKATAGYLLIWAAMLVAVNQDGWNLVASIYLVVVPLVTAVTAIHLMPARTPLLSPVGIFWPVSAAVILTLLWSLALDRHMFINIRDHLLLGNRVGQSITGAYYAYTLFPAEAFKSLNQKQMRTLALDASLDRHAWSRIEQTLRAHDYLPIPAGDPADLTIGADSDNKGFSLADSHRIVIKVPEGDLLNNTANVLADYSQELDRNRLFRTLTLTCLLWGFPLVLFALLFSLLGSLPNLFLTVQLSDIIAASLCVLVGGLLLLPVYRGHTTKVTSAESATHLSAPSAVTRIAALRQAYEDRQDIAAEAKDKGLDTSPNIAERYWLARSLAYAKDPLARSMLSKLADDPMPIVACQALWAMGERNNREVIHTLIDRINASSHWYVQMYTYRSLRKLGWVQPRSPQLSY